MVQMSQSDLDLWRSFKTGDKLAFKKIYYKHYMLLFNYGLKLCMDENLAEDSLQDLFLKLWKNRDNLAEISSIKSYLYRAYSNTLYDAIKKSKRKYDSGELVIEEFESNIEDILISDQLTLEQNAELNIALQHLTKRQKQVVNLYYYEGLSYKQISEILPLQYQAIRNCVHEAIKVLRKNITTRHFDLILILSEIYLFSV